MGIFDRLQYDYSGPGVYELSNDVIAFMNTVPQLLEPWQIEDMSNNDVGGYHTNPVATSSQNIRNTCNTLVLLLSASSANIDGNLTVTEAVSGTTSEITSLFNSINTTSANVGGTNGGVFIEHTNRISGVTPLEDSIKDGVDRGHLPHYVTAMGTGQMITYLTHQSDNISNSAAISGSFTSMFINDALEEMYVTISTYNNTINSSITITSTSDGNGNVTIARVSNLSFETVNSMSNVISTINTTMATRRVHDEVFYTNSRTLSDEYGELRNYGKNMGATANNMLQNFNGSEKLLTRINS